ncbi:MAG: hypothetical protein IIC01_11990 [Planctomycetes bacterium]|nr:hypothetical protein [Planctomycetota bacterium]
MPWYLYLTFGFPATALLAYGQWLGARTLQHDRSISALDSQSALRLSMRRDDRQAINQLGEKIDGLATEVAGLSAQMGMLIDGKA